MTGTAELAVRTAETVTAALDSCRGAVGPLLAGYRAAGRGGAGGPSAGEGHRLHGLDGGRPGAAQPRRGAAGTHSVLRGAGRHQRRLRHPERLDGPPRGNPHRIRGLLHPGHGPVLHQAGAAVRSRRRHVGRQLSGEDADVRGILAGRPRGLHAGTTAQRTAARGLHGRRPPPAGHRGRGAAGGGRLRRCAGPHRPAHHGGCGAEGPGNPAAGDVRPGKPGGRVRGRVRTCRAWPDSWRAS